MFLSNDLIHLVFADETDTYYCNDLLKLNLHQYLWLKLHEKYSAVYFLTPSENTFSVKTYGDLRCAAYEPGRGLWTLLRAESEMGKLLKWVHKQLTSKRSEAAAFVCSLEDFCKTLEYQDAVSALEGIAREKDRTGILVLTVPVSVEKCRDLLLHSPIFEYLHENAVLDIRTGPLRDLYGAIRRSKGESCVFLNAFSQEHIYPVLLHAALEQRGRFLSQKDMETAAGYLVRYLASMELQRDYPLFESRAPSFCMRFQDLYEQLKNDDVWKRLMDRCLKERDLTGNQTENTEYATGFHIVWDNSHYAGKCMTLQIPGGIKRIDTEAERAADILLAIQRELLRPKNRDENSMLCAGATNFLNCLEGVSHDDLDTYKRVLKAVQFCVTWMYIQEQSEGEKLASQIVKSLETYITISNQCHQTRRKIKIGQESAPGTLTDMAIQQAQDKLAAFERALRECQDLVRAFIVNLSMTSSSPDNIMERIEALKQEVEKYPSEGGSLSDPSPSPDGDELKDDAGLYKLDAIDYGHTPPI